MAQTKKAAVKRPPRLEHATIKVFSITEPLERLRLRRPAAFSVLCSILVIGLMWQIASLLKLNTIPNPSWWGKDPYWTFARTLQAAISFRLGFPLTQPLARGLLPALIYVSQALDLRNIGLVRVSTSPRQITKMFYRAVKDHKSGDKIKVICISGRFLFASEHY